MLLLEVWRIYLTNFLLFLALARVLVISAFSIGVVLRILLISYLVNVAEVEKALEQQPVLLLKYY